MMLLLSPVMVRLKLVFLALNIIYLIESKFFANAFLSNHSLICSFSCSMSGQRSKMNELPGRVHSVRELWKTVGKSTDN